MKKTLVSYYCDLCEEKIIREDYVGISVDVLFTTEQTEGYPTEPYIQTNPIDFCHKCFDKYKKSLIMASGAQGRNSYRFRKGD